MAFEFRATTPQDADCLAAFLRGVFQHQPDAPGFTPEDLHWKYWQPREDNPNPRSFVLLDGKKILSHCGLVPAEVNGQDESLTSAHFIDWAAAPKTLSAGANVLRKSASTLDLIFAVGGSPDTRKLLPLLGFTAGNEMVSFARPLRPWRQALTHQTKNWKLPARLVRNSMWSSFGCSRVSTAWSFEACAPGDVPASLWQPSRPLSTGRINRRASTYDYYLKCPFVRFHFLLLKTQQTAAGCLLLAETNGQARVADLWLSDESPANYREAYSLAAVIARERTEAVEIVVAASAPNRLQALQSGGFREYHRERIMRLPGNRTLAQEYDCQLIDNDGSFLTSEDRQYWT